MEVFQEESADKNRKPCQVLSIMSVKKTFFILTQKDLIAISSLS